MLIAETSRLLSSFSRASPTLTAPLPRHVVQPGTASIFQATPCNLDPPSSRVFRYQSLRLSLARSNDIRLKMFSSHVKTRILIISDTHTAGLDGSGRYRSGDAFIHPLPKADLLIHCGDLTNTGKGKEYEKTLDMLKSIDAPVKLVIAGNHDLSLDRDFVLGHLDRYRMTADEAETHWKEMRHFWTGADGPAVQAGITFLDEGHHQIILSNGARVNVYATPYTPEFYDWGFPYERYEDRFNSRETALSDAKHITVNEVEAHGEGATPTDIMITHGPSYARLDRTSRGDLAGCPHLLRAVMRARPLIHCFGHIHEGWGAEVVSWSEDRQLKDMTEAEWRNDGWKTGIVKRDDAIRWIEIDTDAAKEAHAAFVDISAAGKDAVQRGSQTLIVNAAIMDLIGRPSHAPWIVDVDLPRAES